MRALRRGGHETVVVDDLRAGSDPARLDGARLFRCDVGDREALDQVFAAAGPFEGILHFAADAVVPESVAAPLRYYRNNVVGSAVLLEAAVAHGVRAFVLSSSAAVYGHPEKQPIEESAPLAPINPYGATKAIVERMLADVEAAHGLGWTALRYFNACGADPAGGIGECHDPETHLIPLALEAAAGLRGEFSLCGTDYATSDGTCVRDFVHVCDLADAHLRALEALLGNGPRGAYNLGSGTGHSCRQVIEAVERVTGRAVPVREVERRPGDPPILVADATRFRREFGWEPRWSDLDKIVKTAWDWLHHWRSPAR